MNRANPRNIPAIWGDFPCTGGLHLMSQSKGWHTVFTSSLQITWRKACLDTKIPLPTPGIYAGTYSSRGQCLHHELPLFFIFPEKWEKHLYLSTPFVCSCENKYSWLSLSRPRLSRITAYLEVKIWSLPKHENLTTGKKYCGKEEKLLLRSNFSSFPQCFHYISNFKNLLLHIYLLNMVNRIIFPSILQIGYVEVRISRSTRDVRNELLIVL